jgi:hypothetical protein
MMVIILLLVAGLVSSFEPGDACIDALHQLRTQERMELVSTEVLEDNVIAYTLADSPRLPEKTAILVCEREVAAVDEEDDSDVVDDPEAEAPAPADETDDGTDDAAVDDSESSDETAVE